MKNLLLIGYGAMGRTVHRELAANRHARVQFVIETGAQTELRILVVDIFNHKMRRYRCRNTLQILHLGCLVRREKRMIARTIAGIINIFRIRCLRYDRLLNIEYADTDRNLQEVIEIKLQNRRNIQLCNK